MYNIFDVSYPDYATPPKPNDIQHKVDKHGNIIPNQHRKYRYMTLQSVPQTYALKMRVIIGSEQNFYDSIVPKLRRIK